MAMSGPKSGVSTAMAIAGRASRACDVCGSQRARWFCAADDAYLCHRCDQNVHFANALALRHERVRLNPNGSSSSSSFKLHKPAASPAPAASQTSDAPADAAAAAAVAAGSHSGATHRHLRPQPQSLPSRKRSRLSTRPNPHLRAPEVHPKATKAPVKSHKKAKTAVRKGRRDGDGAHEVPSFITVNIEESHVGFLEGHEGASSQSLAEYFKGKAAAYVVEPSDDLSEDSDQFLVPSNGYLESAGADFERAMGASIVGVDDNHIPCIADMELATSGDLSGGDDDYNLDFSEIVGLRPDGTDDGFEEDQDCDRDRDESSEAAVATSEDSPNIADVDETVDAVVAPRSRCSDPPFTRAFSYKVKSECGLASVDAAIKKEVAAVLRCSLEGRDEADAKPAPSLLRLNYEDVLSAWSDRSLWMDGKRPQTVPDDSTSEAMGSADIGLVPDLGHGGHASMAGGGGDDGGREARVMRYREKRRTRLFSKKIRYEVRKLNAERRPRMKGRFVKRTPGCT